MNLTEDILLPDVVGEYLGFEGILGTKDPEDEDGGLYTLGVRFHDGGDEELMFYIYARTKKYREAHILPLDSIKGLPDDFYTWLNNRQESSQLTSKLPSIDTNIPQVGIGVKTARVKSVPRLCYQLTEESLERVWGILNQERPAKVDFNNLTITTNKYGSDVVFTLGSWATTVRDQDADYWAIQDDIFKETYEPIDASQDLWQKKIIDVSYIQIDTIDEATVNLANSFMGTSLTVEGCISNDGIPVQSLEGLQNAIAGNVILKGVKGEVWTTGISNFEKVYERLY